MRVNDPTDTDIVCPKCGRIMQIRNGSTGVFLGCSGYGLKPKERCTETLNLIPGEEAVDLDSDEESESKLLRRLRKCDRCSSVMLSHLIDEKRKIHICSNGPDCPGFFVEVGNYKIKGYDGPTLDCDKCGSESSSSLGGLANILVALNAQTPANCCVAVNLRHPKLTQYRCPS